jgi:hypothetical protein
MFVKKLSWTLNKFQWVDFTGNKKQAHRQLLKGWNVSI